MSISEDIVKALKESGVLSTPQPSIVQRYDNINFAVTLNTSILPRDVSVTGTPTTFLDIYACFTGSGILSVIRTSGTTTVTEQLNSGAALVANAAYYFTIPVAQGETINLQYSVSTTCLKLNIVEEMK